MALDFDGTDDRVDFPAPVSISSSDELTVTCWFRTDDVIATQYLVNLGHQDDFGHVMYFAGDQVAMYISNSLGGAYSRRWGGSSLSTGTWFHLMATSDGSSGGAGINLYLDGTIDHVGNDGSGSARSQDDDWVISGRQTDNTRNVDGRICEVGVWRAVLPQECAIAMSNGASPLDVYPTDTLFMYAPLWGIHTNEPNLVAGESAGTTISAPTTADHAPVSPYLSTMWNSMPVIEEAAPAAVAHRLTLLGVH